MFLPFRTVPHSQAAPPSAPRAPSSDVAMTPLKPNSKDAEEEYHSEAQVLKNSTSVSAFAPTVKTAGPGLAFTSLPDELVAMCYADLSASDLVSLEHVSQRLRHLIAFDSVCWKRCTESRWGHLSSNSVLLSAAARHAGTWKKLYSEKAISEQRHAPWMTLCESETAAILDLIKGEDSAANRADSWMAKMEDGMAMSPPKDAGTTVATGSPVSVMRAEPMRGCLSVVLLVDASSSVTDDDFDAMKTFARALVENLRVTHPEASVAVVQFNQHPKVEVPLTNVCKSKLSSGIDNMEQLMGSTDIAAPIRRARQMLAEEARPGDRAIVLLTDGQTHADELQESEKEARKAAEEVGARLYTLGVGRDIDEIGLGRVAAGSGDGMHFTLRRLVSSK